MLVEERHKRAVGDEGRDAVGFIGREFERADPQEDDRDGDAHQRDADPIGMSDPGKRQTKIADHEFSSGVGIDFGGGGEWGGAAGGGAVGQALGLISAAASNASGPLRYAP